MELIVTSILAFASTNIDDLFILMLFFANNQYKAKSIVLGQYIGFIALIAISFAGSLLGLLVPQSYIGLLGLLPIFFGIRDLLTFFRRQHLEIQKSEIASGNSNRTLTVAAVTFANGGDNIGIYIPLFTTLLIPQKITMVIVFLAMVGIWCLIAQYLISRPITAKKIARYKNTITPIVLILLGIYILYSSGTFKLL